VLQKDSDCYLKKDLVKKSSAQAQTTSHKALGKRMHIEKCDDFLSQQETMHSETNASRYYEQSVTAKSLNQSFFSNQQSNENFGAYYKPEQIAVGEPIFKRKCTEYPQRQVAENTSRMWHQN